ncbi:hypothetical protein QQZ08_007609 [Neonectria magnoliae]|uniref:Uncharacterized protein n=1 Tax=Neonectria magnoliae TaxID=2732573 RepID=A0ABR1HXA6_9HYPO
MRSFVTYTLLASATFASAALERRWEYPDTVPALEKRQEPGTPRYQCHEDCGLLITLGREDGFCDNSEWNERYGRCMICANTFEIWRYYSNGVTNAAEQCGLSPTPSPSGFTASSTEAAEEPTSTEAPAEESTTAPPEEASTTAAGQSTTAAGSTAVDLEPTETSASEATDVTTSASVAVPTTLSTSAQVSQSASGSESASDSAPVASATDSESSATSTTGSLGTVGVTPHATPSSVIVSGAAKHFGFGAAVGVAALAMLSLY